jgi:hypothetical protein
MPVTYFALDSRCGGAGEYVVIKLHKSLRPLDKVERLQPLFALKRMVLAPAAIEDLLNS